MLKFEEKTVVITGTSSGIGRELAEYFAEEGARVIAVSRKRTEYNNDRILGIQGNIKSYNKVFLEIKQVTNQIHILINNAGIIYYSNLLEAEIEKTKDVFDTNVISTLMLSTLVANDMKEKKNGGVIVNTLSFASKIPSAGSGIYAASKAAMESLTRTMSAEFAPFEIRVNGYSPGVIRTGMTEPVLEKNEEQMVNAIALHRIGDTRDVVKAVSFLASDESAYLTGINLDVSGGKFVVQNAGNCWNI
ncbi:MAG: SDR family oxidoreductase [Lachnospiraceae bacterium]|jgi:3-oxoacyl-[acyl-carrier protein] reductase|nr:SDR family oxidoreductase [Lachnospiraceae bacterium]